MSLDKISVDRLFQTARRLSVASALVLIGLLGAAIALGGWIQSLGGSTASAQPYFVPPSNITESTLPESPPDSVFVFQLRADSTASFLGGLGRLDAPLIQPATGRVRLSIWWQEQDTAFIARPSDRAIVTFRRIRLAVDVLNVSGDRADIALRVLPDVPSG